MGIRRSDGSTEGTTSGTSRRLLKADSKGALQEEEEEERWCCVRLPGQDKKRKREQEREGKATGGRQRMGKDGWWCVQALQGLANAKGEPPCLPNLPSAHARCPDHWRGFTRCQPWPRGAAWGLREFPPGDASLCAVSCARIGAVLARCLSPSATPSPAHALRIGGDERTHNTNAPFPPPYSQFTCITVPIPSEEN